MKKLLFVLLLIIPACTSSPDKLILKAAPSIVMLLGDYSGGTGFVVEAPSGKKYVLTNRHVCEDSREVAKRDRRTLLQLVEISKKSDLCLLSANPVSPLPALKVAKTVPSKFQRIFIIGHGGLLPLAITEGLWLGKIGMEVLGVKSPDITTVPILPGNSGSPVLTESLEVVGVAFASSQYINNRAILVPLEDIQDFLKDY